MSGTLYLCATPIGNLDDMTFRAISTLKEVDLIAAEDTRNSIKLLNHFDIHTPMTSYHDHNRFEKAEELVAKLLAGMNIAVITDAGMPGISDPGEELCRMAHEAGITVTVIPGACAAVSALSVSGQPSRYFAFEGFLPRVPKERKERLAEIADEKRTLIIYEAPHRIRRTLPELVAILGENREISICRELTKKHEEVMRLTLGEAAAYYEENEPKGEFVLIIRGKSEEESALEVRDKFKDMSLREHVEYYIAAGHDKKEAMKLAAADLGISKRDVYNALVAEDNDGKK